MRRLGPAQWLPGICLYEYPRKILWILADVLQSLGVGFHYRAHGQISLLMSNSVLTIGMGFTKTWGQLLGK